MGNHMRETIQYSSNFGIYNFVSIWFKRIILLAILIKALSVFSVNPNGLTILAALLFVALFMVKSEQLLIYDKSIEIKRRFFLELIPISTKIQKNEIQSIEVHGNRNLKNNIIQQLLPFGLRHLNTITISLADGSARTYKTSIFTEELESFKTQFEESPNIV